MNFKKKILKFKYTQKFLAYLGYLYILFVCLTSKIKIKNNNLVNDMWDKKKPFILAFWHGQLMMLGYVWKSKSTLNMLASSHSDGRFGAYIAGYFNLKNVSIEAKNKSPSLRQVFKILNNGQYIGITPDGPRGPNQKVSEGIIKISKTTQVPIIPIGFASSKFKRLKSWDSFLITKPFAKCAFVWGDSITIPKNCSENEIEEFKNKLENEINICVDQAKKVINA